MEKSGKGIPGRRNKRERCMGNLGLIMGRQRDWCDWNVLDAAGKRADVSTDMHD